ncbi:MAG TPA: hypothetical protein DCK93_02845 [Blastocatellia bacterium]|jgi:hypothetical protein|nr:hypothetical protein [Blastocatellia bacterium]
MITLKHDTISFAFPEIREQLRLLVDRHVNDVLTSYVLPADRDELVDELGSMRPFWNLGRTAQRNVLAKARFVTGAEIEALLRKAASVAAGLNNASPPQLTIKFEHPPRPPDDAKFYVFSAGLEELPLRPATDFPGTLPASWLKETRFSDADERERSVLDQIHCELSFRPKAHGRKSRCGHGRNAACWSAKGTAELPRRFRRVNGRPRS